MEYLKTYKIFESKSNLKFFIFMDIIVTKLIQSSNLPK